MLQYHIYPGGLKRILTFRFDDGAENDARLISLFDKYNLKATFRLNGISYLGKSTDEKVFYNPTATDVWVERDKKDIIKIPARQKIIIPR